MKFKAQQKENWKGDMEFEAWASAVWCEIAGYPELCHASKAWLEAAGKLYNAGAEVGTAARNMPHDAE